MAAALFSFLLICYDNKNTRAGAVVVRKMNLNENAYTAGERQFVLYEYLRRNATKEHVVTKQDLLNELQRNGIIVHENTLFTDLGILGGKVFGLQLEYDRSKKG